MSAATSALSRCSLAARDSPVRGGCGDGAAIESEKSLPRVLNAASANFSSAAASESDGSAMALLLLPLTLTAVVVVVLGATAMTPKCSLPGDSNTSVMVDSSSPHLLSTWFTGVPLIDALARDGVCGGDVLELFGSSGVGKSELMLQLAIKCVLPAELGGSDCSCVLFDNDCKFDARRLVVVLLATLQRVRHQSVASGTTVVDPDDDDDASVFDPLLRQSLQRIHVIRPRDVVDFVLALRALPDLLDSLPARCRLLLIDSISSWHWSMQNDADGSLYERDLTRFVREIAERHDLVVVAAKQYLYVNSNADALQQHRAVAPAAFVPLHREYMRRAWLELVRLRVTLTCDVIDSAVYEEAAEPRFVAYVVENVDWRGRAPSSEPPRRQSQAYHIAKTGIHFA